MQQALRYFHAWQGGDTHQLSFASPLRAHSLLIAMRLGSGFFSSFRAVFTSRMPLQYDAVTRSSSAPGGSVTLRVSEPYQNSDWPPSFFSSRRSALTVRTPLSTEKSIVGSSPRHRRLAAGPARSRRRYGHSTGSALRRVAARRCDATGCRTLASSSTAKGMSFAAPRRSAGHWKRNCPSMAKCSGSNPRSRAGSPWTTDLSASEGPNERDGIRAPGRAPYRGRACRGMGSDP
jgi:hypothetical protein